MDLVVVVGDALRVFGRTGGRGSALSSVSKRLRSYFLGVRGSGTPFPARARA